VIQRQRILRAMAEVVAERGYAGASVQIVIARAGVSRRTFYRCFQSLEACFLALVDMGLECAVDLVSQAFAGEETWQDGVRAALASLLVFLDSDALLAQVWFVESLGAGAWALERRERNLAVLRTLVVSSWPVAEARGSAPLAAEGAMGSVLAVIHTHIITGKPGSLIGLLGPLMGLVTAHYLPPHEVAREIERGEDLARKIMATEPSVAPPRVAIPALLCNPTAHRVRQCMLFLVDHQDASNREIAAGIGVVHQSQISKLLSCLLGEQLVTRHSAGIGKRNSWRLTAHGEDVVKALTADAAGQVVTEHWEPHS
jgi:AcrR family transcriptional regulator